MPIIKSDLSGEVRGSLLFGRLFNEDRQRDIAEALKMNVSFTARTDKAWSAKQDMVNGLRLDQPTHLEPVSESLLVGYTAFPDVSGNLGLVAKVEIPRDIHAQAKLSMNAVLLFVSILGVFFAIVVALMMETLVLQRVVRMSSQLFEKTENFDFSSGVDSQGADEISRLGHSINGLIAAAEQMLFSVGEGRK